MKHDQARRLPVLSPVLSWMWRSGDVRMSHMMLEIRHSNLCQAMSQSRQLKSIMTHSALAIPLKTHDSGQYKYFILIAPSFTLHSVCPSILQLSTAYLRASKSSLSLSLSLFFAPKRNEPPQPSSHEGRAQGHCVPPARRFRAAFSRRTVRVPAARCETSSAERPVRQTLAQSISRVASQGKTAKGGVRETGGRAEQDLWWGW